MRADFYAKCAANAELAAAFSDHHVLVGPMTEDELRRAIERPTQLVGCELEAGLVDLLVQDVRRQPGALPLLQHALLELWNKREGRRLTVKAYQEIGKLEGALQRRADATLKAFSEDEQELCRRTFLRLTQPGEGTEDTKRRASMQELLSLSGNIERPRRTSSKSSPMPRCSPPKATLPQRCLCGGSARGADPKLAAVAQVDRCGPGGLRTRTRLTEAARDWKNAGRIPPISTLALAWLSRRNGQASHPGELSTDEAEFLARSLEAQSKREASELEAARKLAEALRERAEEAEKREQQEKVSRELRERLAREERDRQEREIEAAQRLARAEAARAEEAEKRRRAEAQRAEEAEERQHAEAKRAAEAERV